jgi:hypothetical protein
MRLRERDMDPRVQRELDALDAALRGEQLDPEFEELAALASELTESRPQATSEFGARLDAEVAEGFSSAPDVAVKVPKRRSWPSLRSAMPRLAVAASVLVAVVVSFSVLSGIEGGSDDSDTDSGLLSGGDQGAVQESAGETGNDAGGVTGDSIAEPAPQSDVAIAPPPPEGPGRSALRPGQERIQEQNASMKLSTEPDEVDDVADEVISVVDRYDGIVVSSDVSVSDGEGRAGFDLRIPTQNLQATLADLSDLASVSSRDEGLRDITAPFITAEERFGDAKAEADALVEGLTQADSAAEIAQIKAQLAIARQELAAARAELAGLKQRADFSTLSLVVVGDGDADGWSIGDAVDDAGSVLETLGGAILVALAVIVPMGAIAFLASLGLRHYRRRRRESALDD